jgi:hypothetical protein
LVKRHAASDALAKPVRADWAAQVAQTAEAVAYSEPLLACWAALRASFYIEHVPPTQIRDDARAFVAIVNRAAAGDVGPAVRAWAAQALRWCEEAPSPNPRAPATHKAAIRKAKKHKGGRRR